MGRVQLYYKVARHYLAGNTITAGDIGCSYSVVSSGYNGRFLENMHKYNVAMLEQIKIYDGMHILDLACGTGFNSEWLLSRLGSCTIDAVDISEGMLEQADKRLEGKVKLIRDSMLSFAKKCDACSYDLIVCGWALKYEPPVKLLKECFRILKSGGQIAVIVNSKKTLPEMRLVYKKLLIRNSHKVNKLMLELPNPKDEKQLAAWYKRAGFDQIKAFRGMQKFTFPGASEMTEWVTSTGALAGFDIMLDLHDSNIKEQITGLFRELGLCSVTHDFVWGVAKKC